MKKRKLLFGIIAATAMVSLVSCGSKDNKDSSKAPVTTEATPSTNPTSSLPVSTNNTPTTPSTEVTPTTPSTEVTTPTTDVPVGNAPKVSFYETAESTPTVIECVKDGNEYYLPTTGLPSFDYEFKELDGWYTEPEGGTKIDLTNNTFTQDTNVYAHFKVATEEASFTFDADKQSAQSITSDTTFGKFVLTTGCEIRSENKKYTENGTTNTYAQGVKLNSAMKVNVDGPGTLKIYFAFRGNSATWVKNANGQYVFPLKVTKPDGTIETVQVQFLDEANKTTAYTMDVVKGVYEFTNDGSTLDVLKAELNVTIEKSKEVGITATPANVDYIVGQSFSKEGLAVVSNFENGTTRDLDDTKYTVDSSNFDSTKSGTYEIIVKSGTFESKFNVHVYKVDTIELFDFVEDSGVTKNLQKVFLQNDSFNTKNIAVHAHCSVEGSELTKEFIVSDYTVSTVGTSALGKQTVTITYQEKTATYDVYVVENVFESADTATVNVDAAAADVTVATTGVTFKTVNDALQYLRLCQLDADTKKTINVAAGTYKEKVEVDIPNLTLIGASKDTTTITFDAIAGMMDPSGKTAYGTNGSATMSVRSSAYGFTMKNIKVMNYYNTNALYQVSLTISPNSQAVALLVEADMSVFDNCILSSYHDTLYANKGRQYYVNCHIEGRTDYIFGDTATAYFKTCEIMSIGAGTTEKNGGYVVATKGSGVEFGYIFDGCTFDGDENVQDGSVSLGRTWNTAMKMAVVNCTISGKFSKEAYGDTTSELNDRYTQMKTDASYALQAGNMVEYNNTGAGAITESIANTCTVLTAEQAANYTDLDKVFATTNGSVTYTTAWNPIAAKDATVVFKDAEGNVLGTAAEAGYSGKTLTLGQYKNLFSDNVTLPEGKALDSLYKDATFTTPLTEDDLLVSGDNVVYAKIVNKSSVAVTYTLQSSLNSTLCDGNKVTADTTISDQFFMTNGDKGATNTGTNSDVYPYYVQTGGSAQVSSNAGKNLIGINVTGPCTITIYYSSASADGSVRTLSIYSSLDDVKNKVATQEIGSSSDYTVVSGSYTYTGTEESIIYIGTSNGMRVYDIVIKYN